MEMTWFEAIAIIFAVLVTLSFTMAVLDIAAEQRKAAREHLERQALQRQ